MENNKNDLTYYFVRDPQFPSVLFWEIIATIINPIFGIAALVYLVIAHNSFKAKDLNKSLNFYDISKKIAVYGCYLTAAILVIALIVVIIKMSR